MSAIRREHQHVITVFVAVKKLGARKLREKRKKSLSSGLPVAQKLHHRIMTIEAR